MMIDSTQGWAKWLKDHASNAVYDENLEAVMKLCNSKDEVVSYDNVSKFKSIVLLKKAPICAKLQLSFYHSVVEIPIMPEKLHYVANI